MLNRCAVIGHPVAHSLSPALHHAAYRALGLDWSYQRIDVPPGGVGEFIASLDESWRGISATMPHKEGLAQVGVPDEVVRLTGVANTWVRTAGGAIVRNTDVSGFGVALGAQGVTALGTALIVGNGATARSSLLAVQRLGAASVTLVARNVVAADALAEWGRNLGVDVEVSSLDAAFPPVDIAISTVPVVGSGPIAARLAASARIVFDSVYDPWPTPLATSGAERGRLVLNGLDLLAGQAVDQVRLMTGGQVSFELLRAAAAQAIAER